MKAKGDCNRQNWKLVNLRMPWLEDLKMEGAEAYGPQHGRNRIL